METFRPVRNLLIIFFAFFILTLLAGCASSKNPRSIFDHREDAYTAYNAGKYEIASEKFEYLVKEVPKDAELWFRLANSYARSGEPDRAISAYRNTLLRDPNYEKAWYNMGVIQMQQALKTFVDMQEHIPAANPVRIRGSQKMDGLFILLGKKAATDNHEK